MKVLEYCFFFIFYILLIFIKGEVFQGKEDCIKIIKKKHKRLTLLKSIIHTTVDITIVIGQQTYITFPYIILVKMTIIIHDSKTL